MDSSHSSRVGFSLLEMLLVLGMGVVAVGVATPMYLNSLYQSDLGVATSAIVQAVEQAKTLATSSKEDSGWGVHIPTLTLFAGSTYATRNPSFDMPISIPSSVTVGGLSEFSYSKLEGIISQSGIITLLAKNGSTASILVDGYGAHVLGNDNIDALASSFFPSSFSSVGSTSSGGGAAGSVPSSAMASSANASAFASESSSASSSIGSVGSSASSSSQLSSVASSGVSVSSSSVSSMSSVVSSGASSSISSSVASSIPVSVEWRNQNVGILLLDPPPQNALRIPLYVTGNGAVHVAISNGVIVVNSPNGGPIRATGNGEITASAYHVTGVPGVRTNGNGKIIGSVLSGVDPTPDPLASLPIPTPPTQTFSGVDYSGNNSVTLNPGTYIRGIKVRGNASVTLNPGIYYLQSGGLKIGGNASVVGNGVMIYNHATGQAYDEDVIAAGEDDRIIVTGNGKLNLTPMTTGIYAGISLFVNRAFSDIVLSGNAVVNMSGILYGPNTALSQSGNANLNLQCTDTSRYILRRFESTGNGGFNML